MSLAKKMSSAKQQEKKFPPRHQFEHQLLNWLEDRGYAVSQYIVPFADSSHNSRFLHLCPKNPNKSNFKTCLLAHGTGFDALFPLAGAIRELADCRQEIFTFDLPGHGFYSQGTLERKSVESCGDEALDFVRERSINKKQKISAIGFSLGGSVLLEAVTCRPDDFEMLILVGVPSRLATTRNLVGEGKLFFQKAFWDALSLYSFWELLPSLGRFKREAYPIRLSSSDKNFGYVEIVRRLITDLYESSLARTLAKDTALNIPCVRIGSEGDSLAPITQIGDFKKIFSNFDSIIVKDLTHYNLLLSPETAKKIAAILDSEHLS